MLTTDASRSRQQRQWVLALDRGTHLRRGAGLMLYNLRVEREIRITKIKSEAVP